MNKYYLLAWLFCISLIAHAQSSSLKSESNGMDPRITEVFGSEIGRVQSDPQRVKDLNDILSKRTEIIEIKQEKGEKFTKLSSVPLFNKYNPELKRDASFDRSSFNVLKYDLQFFSATDKVYRIDGTDFVLIIHPQTRK